MARVPRWCKAPKQAPDYRPNIQTDRRDPRDGRERIISIDSRAFEQTSDEIDDIIQWINDFLEHGLSN